MSLGSVARQERSLVCDLMEQVGAGAPTLAEGWTVLDLAAHLVVREHDLWAAPGLVLGGPFRRAIEAAMNWRRRRGLENLVATIRRGPPGVARLLPPGAHLSEYFIHHEDVRRANGLAPRRDRDLDEVWHCFSGRAPPCSSAVSAPVWTWCGMGASCTAAAPNPGPSWMGRPASSSST